MKNWKKALVNNNNSLITIDRGDNSILIDNNLAADPSYTFVDFDDAEDFSRSVLGNKSSKSIKFHTAFDELREMGWKFNPLKSRWEDTSTHRVVDKDFFVYTYADEMGEPYFTLDEDEVDYSAFLTADEVLDFIVVLYAAATDEYTYCYNESTGEVIQLKLNVPDIYYFLKEQCGAFNHPFDYYVKDGKYYFDFDKAVCVFDRDILATYRNLLNNN